MTELVVLESGVVARATSKPITLRRRSATLIRRHPFASVLLVALVVRILMAIVLRILFDGHVFGDESYYQSMATDIARSRRGRWTPYDQRFAEITGGFLVPLALIYRVFGIGSVAGQLLVVGFGVATVGVTMWLAYEVLPKRWTVIAGLFVALLPSGILWSSLTLKDAQLWSLVGLVAVAVALSTRAHGLALAAILVSGSASLLVLAFVRQHSFVVACLALLAAVWLGPRKGLLIRGLGGTVLAIGLPWMVGLGPLGTTLIFDSGSLEFRRAANAEDARTAFVPSVSKRRQASSSRFDDSLGANLAHLPRGLFTVIFEPVPWRSGSTNVRLGGLEALIWYPMLFLAAAGVPFACRHRRALAFPVLYAAGMVVLYALTEGNIGTSFRHRAEAAWVVCVLAAGGACVLWGRWTSVRSARE